MHLAVIYTSEIANMISLVMQTSMIANLLVLRSSVLLGYEKSLFQKFIIYADECQKLGQRLWLVAIQGASNAPMSSKRPVCCFVLFL